MSSDAITFFDIPTRSPQVCWSMNTWRSLSMWLIYNVLVLTFFTARLLLNYKKLKYETEWVSLPFKGTECCSDRCSLNTPTSRNDSTNSKK
jgi:hypothetical protein